MRKQTAVYWPLGTSESGGTDIDGFGVPVLGTPVQIEVRWEDVTEQFLDKENNPQISRAKVYVDRDVDVGGVLMLGTLEDVLDETRAKNNVGAWEIRKFDKIPNLKATEYLRIAIL
jgi:hypothetical protein